MKAVTTFVPKAMLARLLACSLVTLGSVSADEVPHEHDFPEASATLDEAPLNSPTAELQKGPMSSPTIIIDEDLLSAPIVALEVAWRRRYTICHRPRSNNPRTIVVGLRSARAHLRHGDRLGRCPRRRLFTICHIPRNNPAKARTLRVNQRLLRFHLRHGDRRGRCDDTPPTSP